MQVNYVSYPLFDIKKIPAIAAIGYFDGVHLGHQTVIKQAIARAKKRNLASALITFDPHPREVLKKDEIVTYITPLEEKLLALRALGVDLVYVIQFTWEFSQITPKQFIDEVLLPLGIEEVVVGFDFRFGKGGIGTPKTIEEESGGQIAVHVIDPVREGEHKISSSLIREKMKLGDIEPVNQYLTRAYTIRGTVVHGQKKGREIGFPTANIALHDRYLIPLDGVYGVRVTVDTDIYYGVMNIGVRPTIAQDELERSIEIHLLDFDQEIYGKRIAVEILFRIRAEQRFASLADLKEQISKDIVFAKEKFLCYTI